MSRLIFPGTHLPPVIAMIISMHSGMESGGAVTEIVKDTGMAPATLGFFSLLYWKFVKVRSILTEERFLRGLYEKRHS